jgi:flagellar hook-associated protein 1 FlgK
LATSNELIQPNDLLDQRDNLLRQLNQEVQATTVMQSDGSVNVFFGNGQPAVVGTKAYALQAQSDPADPMSTRVLSAASLGVL